jgi:hypothetical protein
MSAQNPSLGDSIGEMFGIMPSGNNVGNYYQQAAENIMGPARNAEVSDIAAQKTEAANTAQQRNAIQGITGPMAVENQQRNDRLVGEAGNRNLQQLDETGRQAMYAAAEKDRQEQLAEQTAQMNAIFNGVKMGAGLLSGGLTGGLTGALGSLSGTKASTNSNANNTADTGTNTNDDWFGDNTPVGKVLNQNANDMNLTY